MPVLIGGLLLVTAGPAAACSCGQQSQAQAAAQADAVFVGRRWTGLIHRSGRG
jgi:hypothetical protein